jgi:hypothetical protein
MRKFLFWIAKVIVGIIVVGVIVFLVVLQFSYISTIIESLKSLTEIAAISIGGLWTYNRFIKNREDYPYPEIEHEIEHWDLENDKILVRVYVIVRNKGKVMLDLSKGRIYIRRVKPLEEKIKTLIEGAETEELRNGLVKDLFLKDELLKIAWSKIGYRDWGMGDPKREKLSLEPEQTKILPFDFLIGDGIELIEVISFLDDEKREANLLTDPPTSTLHSLVDDKKTGLKNLNRHC